MNATAAIDPNRYILPELLGLALLFRLVFLLAMPRVLDTADAIHYVETAAHLARGDFLGYDPKIPVFYPLLGALAHGIIGNLEWACRIVSFVTSVLTVVPVYLLARELHGPETARIAGIIVALWPWLADYACRVSTEATAVLLWFSAVCLFVRGLRQGGPALYASALCCFALALTRPEGLAILACTLPAFTILQWKPGRAAWGQYGRFAAPGILFVVLNMVYVRLLSGATTASYRAGFILAEFDIQRFVQTAVHSFSDVVPVMLGPILFLFLGVGLIQPRAGGRDLRAETCVLFFAAAQWGVSLFVLSPAPRYLMATLLVLAIWSARGMVLAGRQMAAWQPERPWLSRLPVAALVAFFLAHAAITVGSEHLGRQPREPREYKEAGLWMAAHVEPGLIFTRKPQVGFYAGMPSTGPAPDDSLEGALARARGAGAAYVVVDERYTAAMAPALRPLLEDGPAPAGLERLKAFDTYPQSRVVIYALKPAAVEPAP